MGDIGFADAQRVNDQMLATIRTQAGSQVAAGNREAADELNGEAQAIANSPNKVTSDAIYATLQQHGENLEFLDNVLHRDGGDAHGMYDAAQFDKVMADLGNAELIKSVYQDQLGRMPDGQGLKDWSGVIDNLRQRGMSDDAIKAELTRRVQASDEYASKHPAAAAAPVAPTAGSSAPAGAVIPPDSLDGTHGGQCVVFVEHETGTYFPVGAAKDMLANGNHPGYQVVSTPQPGDVFVATGGEYGHTGIVKSVNPDGSLNVIDSNYGLNEVVQSHTLPAGYAAGYLRRDPSQAARPYSG